MAEDSRGADGRQRILVVCAANRARSPIVEYMLKSKLAALGRAADVEVSSAGLCAAELERTGLPAEETAARVAAEHGVDLSEHRARPLRPAMIDESDLIVVMEEWQQKILATVRPEARDRIARLHELAGEAREAPDIARLPERSVQDFFREADATVTASLADGLMARLLENGSPPSTEVTR